MVVKYPELLDARRAWSNLSLRHADVLKILTTTGVRAVSRRDESERVLNAVRRHAVQRVRKHRMPVAIAPVDRQTRAVLVQLLLERRYQISVLLIDRTDPAEQFVVTRHLQH